MMLKKKIKKFENLAKQILKLKEEKRQRRPIVIEFCGTPKAGKTSCINSLNIFLKRNNFNTFIITKRASVCPIKNKHSPEFNIWTVTSTINQLNDQVQKQNGIPDIIICDRGIFDALCWFNWLKEQNKLSSIKYKHIINFVKLDLWLRNIDLVYVFKAKPSTAIEREYANLLTRKRGSVMNERVLDQYNKSIDNSVRAYSYLFNFEIVNTDDKNQNIVSEEVADKTLEVLDNMLHEKIAYFEMSSLNKIFPYGEFVVKDYIEVFNNKIKFDLRDSVESNSELIQPIPIAVITDYDCSKILVLKKNQSAVSKTSPEKDKLLFYAGGHIRKEDVPTNNQNDFIQIAKYSLEREIKEELDLSVSFDNPECFGIYTPDTPKSKQHVAICFVYKCDIETLKITLDVKELVQKKGTTKSGKFIEIKEIDGDYNIESWSKIILNRECFKNKLSDKGLLQLDERQQLTIDKLTNYLKHKL